MKASSELGIRVATGLLLIVLASLLILFGGSVDGVIGAAGPWTFRIAIAAIAALMLVEWNAIHGLNRGWSYLSAVILALLLALAAEWLFPIANIGAVLS